jgi:hypothetical protein
MASIHPLLAIGALIAWMGSALAPSEAPGPRGLLGPAPEAGRLHVRVRDAASGGPLAARVRVEGAGLTFDPPRPTAVTADGEATLQLPPGRYRVTASRGPEWTLDVRVVELAPGGEAALEAALRRLIDPGDHVACDFHVHAAPSPDSEVDLRTRVASLAAEGVRFAVATDHNHVTDYGEAVAALGLSGFGTAPGVEVSTWEPSFGHFNAWPLTPDPADRRGGAPRFSATTPAALFAALHALGPDVLVQVNHPRLDEHIGYFDHVGFDPQRGRAARTDASFDFDAVEVWNGYELAAPEALDANLRDWMALLARGHRVVATGNSDSHDVDTHAAGYPRTYVRVAGGAVDDPVRVARALRAGRAFVTSGPFLEVRVDGRGPGATVHTDGVARLEVVVRLPAWMTLDRVQVWLGGARVADEALPRGRVQGGLRRIRWTRALAVHEPTFVVVRVRGPTQPSPLLGGRQLHPTAFGNPIWLR